MIESRPSWVRTISLRIATDTGVSGAVPVATNRQRVTTSGTSRKVRPLMRPYEFFGADDAKGRHSAWRSQGAQRYLRCHPTDFVGRPVHGGLPLPWGHSCSSCTASIQAPTWRGFTPCRWRTPCSATSCLFAGGVASARMAAFASTGLTLWPKPPVNWRASPRSRRVGGYRRSIPKTLGAHGHAVGSAVATQGRGSELTGAPTETCDRKSPEAGVT